ncbi:MAG: BrnT family toxin [Acidobacteriia bacterium]|nr:BrnT family toxin [Terriglobia bacterium]
MRYTFEWDPIKAKENLRKHRVSFDRAAEVLLDPLAVSVIDEEHSEHEGRWATIGKDRRGMVLILVHTFLEVSAEECRIRIISARKASKRETRQYEET